MYAIYIALTVGLLWLNLAGLTALTSRWVANPALARATGLLVLGMIFFFVEHFLGLGKLTWLWPLTSLFSAYLLWQRRSMWQEPGFRTDLVVFSLILLYGLVWRWRFPNIDGATEHLTDLLFIANYQAGARLPAPDLWMPGHVFDFYYGFQHYIAALMGRILGLEVGVSMNLACAVLLAFSGSLAWSVANLFITKNWPKVLLVAALVVGGSGLSPILPLSIQQPTLAAAVDPSAVQTRFWAGVRFSGVYDKEVNTPLGRALFGRADREERNDLPLETISFYNFLGDYHPPLGGFALMLYTLGLMGMLIQRKSQEEDAPAKRERLILTALLAATPVLILAINAWVFPLQLALSLAGLYWLYREEKLDWRAMFAGGGAAIFLIYPFFSHFAPVALASPLKWVEAGQHTLPAFFLAFHWPTLLLMAVGLFFGLRHRWAFYLTLLLFGFLCLSEMVYVDDPLGGTFSRFNTTLKWWSWIWPAALIGLGSVIWAQGGRVARTMVTFICVAVLLVPAFDTLCWWTLASREHAGQLAGTGWLKSEPAHRSMLDYLRNAPHGRMLEDPEGGAYNNSSAFALFTGNPSVIGWPNHEFQWRGNAGYVNDRAEEARALYRAQLANPLDWLQKYQVRYIVWANWSDSKNPGAWAQLNEQIGQDYYWRGFHQFNEQHYGLWERR